MCGSRGPAAAVVFALQAYPVSRFASFSEATRAYLDETGGRHGCIGAAIGAAGLVSHGKVSLTNLAWDISEAEVSSRIERAVQADQRCRGRSLQRARNFGGGLFRTWPRDAGSSHNAPHSGGEHRDRLWSGHSHTNGRHLGFLPKRSRAYVAQLSGLGGYRHAAAVPIGGACAFRPRTLQSARRDLKGSLPRAPPLRTSSAGASSDPHSAAARSGYSHKSRATSSEISCSPSPRGMGCS